MSVGVSGVTTVDVSVDLEPVTIDVTGTIPSAAVSTDMPGVVVGVPGHPGPKGDPGDDGVDGADGAPGADGEDGTDGAPGATGPKGDPGIVWKGDWDWQADYKVGESVSYGGVSWVAYVDPPLGETPPSHPEHWQMVADKGQPGAQGVQGAKGDKGDPGTNGAPGAQGNPGIASQFVAPANWYVYPQGILNTGATAQVDQQAAMLPIWLLPGTYDSLLCSVSVAQAGGATVQYLAVYGVDSTGYFPDTASGPKLSGTIDNTVIGSRSLTGPAFTVTTAGMYWTCGLYVVTTAPTTIATLQGNVNQTIMFPSTGFSLPSNNRGRARAGVTALPTGATSQANFTQVGLGNVPVIGVRKAT